MQKTCKRAGVPAGTVAAVFFAATVFAPSEASADWVFNRGAKTISNSETGVTIKVGKYAGQDQTYTRLQIENNENSTSAWGDIDLTEPIYETVLENGTETRIPCTLEKLNKKSFRGTQIGVVKLPDECFQIGEDSFNNGCTVTKVVVGTGFTSLGNGWNHFNGAANLETFDFSKAAGLVEVQNGAFASTAKLSEKFSFPDSLNVFGASKNGGSVFRQSGTAGSGLEVEFGASAVPETLADNSFSGSGLVSLDLSKLTALRSIDSKALFECHKLEKVYMPSSVYSLAGKALGKHVPADAALSVYFRSCPQFGDVSPFAESHGNNPSPTAATSVTMYVPRYASNATAKWNEWARAWVSFAADNSLGETYGDPADASTKRTGLRLPESKDGETTWVVSGSSGGSVAKVRFWDDPDASGEETDAGLALAAHVGEVGYTNASFSVTVVSVPAGASSVAFALQLSQDPDFGEVDFEKPLGLDGPGGETVAVENLAQGTAYHVRVVAEVDGEPQEPFPVGRIKTLVIDPDGKWIFDEERNVLYRGAVSVSAVSVLSAEKATLSVGDNKANASATELDFRPGIAGGWKIARFEEGAFQGNAAVSVLDLTCFEGAGVSLWRQSFRECQGLVRLALPSDAEVYDYAFYRCRALESANWETFAPGLSAVNGETFSEAAKLGGDPVFSEATKCGEWAFDAVPLTSATFGDALVSVDRWAFKGSPALTNVVFGYGLKTIGEKAFGNRSASCPVLNISFKACPEVMSADFLSGSPTDAEGRNVVVWIPYGNDGDGSTGPWLAAAEAWWAYAADDANGLSLPATRDGEGLWTPSGGGSATVFFWRDPDLVPPATMFMLR